MGKKIFAVVAVLAALPAALAAQARVEFRKSPEGGDFVSGAERLAVIVPFAEADFQTVDEVRELGPGVFEWTRTFTFNGNDYARPARLTMEIEALSKSRYNLIPAVSYDGNLWGTGQEPKGFSTDVGPWTFAYHRSSIPGATYSESEKWSVGFFSRPGQLPGGFSCALVPNEDRTLHRLIWPEEETPRVYAARDRYAEPYREDLRVSRDQVFSLKAWVVIAPVAVPKFGWKTMLDTAWRLNAHPISPTFEPEHLWELGIQFAKECLWAEEKTFKGFSIGLLWSGGTWVQRPSWKYEIGWAGQNISLANSLLSDYVKTGDEDSLNKGVQCLDTWLRHARLKNGLFRCHFDYLLGLEDPKGEVQDACNLGAAAMGYFEASDLATSCGLKKPEYRAAALGVCDFVLRIMGPDGRIGRTWTNGGRPVDPEGTTGAFLIQPLVRAYRVSHKGEYLAAAERAFAFYFGGLAADGYTTAGALDTHCIDKESAVPLLKAALELFEATRKDMYLRRAEDAAFYLATWQWHYTVPYHESSVLAGIGYDTLGGTSVSTQHHHQDPYALVIVNDWLKLASLTKNDIWRERALAVWANGTIGVSDGDLVILGKRRPAGSQDEGAFHTRWHAMGGVSQWLVAWPTAFRLETLRHSGYWAAFDKK